MELKENSPLDTLIVADLIRDREDLYLVWPEARYPFDHDQWREVLDPGAGNRPFLVYDEGRLIGHAALRKTLDPALYRVSFLYLRPEVRAGGLGGEMLRLLEEYGRERLGAERLTLYVRTYNSRALRCYEKAGFKRVGLEGSLILMSKDIIVEE